MKIEGRIPELSDIQIKPKIKNYQTSESVDVGVFRFLATSPSQILDVHVSEALVKDNKTIEALKASVDQRIILSIEYKELAFANAEGRHVEIKGFHLFEPPQVQRKA
jgi:succinylarginine dihydrolase